MKLKLSIRNILVTLVFSWVCNVQAVSQKLPTDTAESVTNATLLAVCNEGISIRATSPNPNPILSIGQAAFALNSLGFDSDSPIGQGFCQSAGITAMNEQTKEQWYEMLIDTIYFQLQMKATGMYNADGGHLVLFRNGGALFNNEHYTNDIGGDTFKKFNIMKEPSILLDIPNFNKIICDGSDSTCVKTLEKATDYANSIVAAINNR